MYRIRLNPYKCVFAIEAGLATSTGKASPLFSLLKKESNFEWTLECEAAFQEFKFYLSSPSILCKPKIGKLLFLYLLISDSAIASVLVREVAKQ